ASGTAVLSRVAGNIGGTTRGGFRWAAVSTPAKGEMVCGDAWHIAEREDEIAVMVTDGLGHGPLAAEAAEAARAVFKSDPFGSSGSMISKAHTALAGGRGAALAAGEILSRGPRAYAGGGNI